MKRFALVLVVAGCAWGGGEVFVEPDRYDWSIRSVVFDDCWPSSETLPPLINFEMMLDGTEDLIVLEWEPQYLVQAVQSGSIEDGWLYAAGTTLFIAGSGCSLQVSGTHEAEWSGFTLDGTFTTRYESVPPGACAAHEMTMPNEILIPLLGADDTCEYGGTFHAERWSGGLPPLYD